MDSASAFTAASAVELLGLNEIDSVASVRERYSSAIRHATRSPRSIHVYDAAWRHFASWCSENGRAPLPADEETLILYLLYWGHPDVNRRAEDRLLSRSTIRTYLHGVKWSHLQSHSPWPTYGLGEADVLKETVRLIEHRQRDIKQRPKGRAIAEAKLLASVRSIDDTKPEGLRDRALLLTTFYGAFRREEVVRLTTDDLEFSDDEHDEGMTITLRSSKTDPHGKGAVRAISRTYIEPCPVLSMRDWLNVRGLEPGPIFTNIGNRGPRQNHGGPLTPSHVNKLIKRSVARIGEDPSRYSAHSMRAGLATSAARAGVEPRLIKLQTGHASYEMLDRYIHSANSLSDNVVRAMHPR